MFFFNHCDVISISLRLLPYEITREQRFLFIIHVTPIECVTCPNCTKSDTALPLCEADQTNHSQDMWTSHRSSKSNHNVTYFINSSFISCFSWWRAETKRCFSLKCLPLKNLTLTFEKLEWQTAVTDDQNVCLCSDDHQINSLTKVFSISYKNTSFFTAITWLCQCRGVWVCARLHVCVFVLIGPGSAVEQVTCLGKMEINESRSLRLQHDPLTWSIISFSIGPNRSDGRERPTQNSVTLWHFHVRCYIKNALWPTFADLFMSVQYVCTYFLPTLCWFIWRPVCRAEPVIIISTPAAAQYTE